MSQQDALTPLPQKTTVLSLTDLPDDILLRIISETGRLGIQVGTAYCLGAVSTRFRRLLKSQFLASITQLSQDCISSLSLSDAGAARASLTSMFSSTPAVRELNFNGCSPTLLSRSCLTALAQSAGSSLTKVDLAYCNVTDDVVRPLLRCPNLRKLILQRCDGLTGRMFDEGSCVAPLEYLDLSWVPSLTLDGVQSIANVVTLKELVLKGCEAVNSKTIAAFMMSDIRYSITSMSLAYCPLTGQDLFQLLKSTAKLTELALAENHGNVWMAGDFPDSCIAELRSTYPRVNIKFVT